MIPEQFFDNFGHLADAPNGVQKLRELILQLAVRGKLVPQDPADEPAAKLLERIRAEKAQLVKEKKMRKADPLPAVTVEDAPYELPQGWEWVRLGCIGSWAIGSGFPNSEQGHRGKPILFCKVSDMNLPGNDRYILSTNNSIDESTARRIRAKAHEPGTVIFPKIGGAIATNKRRILTRPTAIDNNCLGITPNGSCTTEWLFLLLTAIDLAEYQSGTSVPALSQGVLENIVTGLPSLAEQHRIVAKVDQLMALCDELEARQQKSQKKLLRLNNAALDRLTCASSADDFAAAWQFVRDRFDLLYITPETIGKLRQAILQLAIQGKLVPQDSADEPAAKLLERILAEKERLLKENKIRKADLLAPVTSGDAPYELPEGWAWSRVGEVAQQFVDCPHDTPHYTGSGYICLRAPNIVHSSLLLEEVRYVSEGEYHKRIQRLQPQKDDLIYIREGGRLGIAGIITLNESFCLGQRLMLVRFMNPTTASYVCYFLNAPRTYEAFVGKVLGGASPHVNVRDVVAHPVPLPPLAEQERIIAKVHQLMRLCDDVEARLARIRGKAERMTAAAVQGVLAA